MGVPPHGETTLPLPPGGWYAMIDRVEDLVAAVAILVGEDQEHLPGSFPAVFDAVLVPARIFTEESEPRCWLTQFVEAPTASPPSET